MKLPVHSVGSHRAATPGEQRQFPPCCLVALSPFFLSPAYWLDASITKRPPLHRFMLQLHHLRTWPCHDQFQKLAGVYHIVGDRDVRSLRNISIAILRNKLLLYIVLERWWLWKVDEAMTREFDEIDLWSDEEDSK